MVSQVRPFMRDSMLLPYFRSLLNMLCFSVRIQNNALLPLFLFKDSSMGSKKNKRSLKGHSEDFFSDYRDFWWNKDFLDLMAKRLNLKQHKVLLDVGCGQCHWSKLLAGYLGSPAKVYGTDTDPKWLSPDEGTLNYFSEKDIDFSLRYGDAQELPFPDHYFDMVTCQTVLIHVKYPQLAISEMMRVLKPGGTILCAEPNNMIQNLTKSSVSVNDSVEDVLDHVKYALICERGKKMLGQGDNSLGDLVPGFLAEAGFKKINVCLSDKTIPMYPPYKKEEQMATLEQWSKGSTWKTEETSDLHYFKAFGDRYLEFYHNYHARYSGSGERFFSSIEEELYHSAGGTIMYLISGIKP